MLACYSGEDAVKFLESLSQQPPEVLSLFLRKSAQDLLLHTDRV
jgi:hypothetical protein